MTSPPIPRIISRAESTFPLWSLYRRKINACVSRFYGRNQHTPVICFAEGDLSLVIIPKTSNISPSNRWFYASPNVSFNTESRPSVSRRYGTACRCMRNVFSRRPVWLRIRFFRLSGHTHGGQIHPMPTGSISAPSDNRRCRCRRALRSREPRDNDDFPCAYRSNRGSRGLGCRRCG